MNTINTHIFTGEADEVDFARRFGGIARLYGDAALQRFRATHVCVIGVGGVGSWTVEALARSAIGQLTLIDLDNVAESNINRQIQALSGTIGQAKVGALAERIAQINPFCRVNLIEDFIDPGNLDQMIQGRGYDFVIDAIDHVRSKAALIAYCRDHAIPMITIGSAGGQVDPSRIEIRDLSKTEQEPMLKIVRKKLRNEYGFPRSIKTKFNVDAVFSMEPLTFPAVEADSCEIEEGTAGVSGLNCAGFGSSMVVTATFGMLAAGHLLRKLAADANGESEPQQAAVQPEAAALS
ncbi:tRNA cyclic N6-threonylcarbamoyladenosine(37) synthase TcdA [Massilia sp. RP-1-19]|uniref:tRNA cyclic N6-threonylcarbamoyladenosine(37) synthase TcdA n=1 Tax=Massilia polaris TaxID=2728846 RepID=A0A848HKJ1_9BURK|nr:tRNA cyclic N6-threonylcarbamoyladenosine(37) synthase TcdA [Massilia polaris]NML61557.1 tRNA cyclic N6-threonylcarbamoyladenosine(37) synthase TcdA [Massilia polaris]